MSDQLLNCLSCDLEFSQSKALIEHISLAHLPKKVFLHKCSKCPKEFISRKFLDKHRSDKHKSVHEEKMTQDKGGIISESVFNLTLKKKRTKSLSKKFSTCSKKLTVFFLRMEQN